MSPKEGTSWLRYGCFGCLAAIGLVIVVVASLVGIAALTVRSEKVTSRELAPELPPAPEPSTAEPSLPAGAPLRLVLDVHGAGFEIRRGEKLHVEASYPEGSYELTEQLEHGENGETVYRVTFRGKGSGLFAALRQMLGGEAPKGVIEIPADIPIALEADLGRGGIEADLGGLWLTSANIKVSQGGFALGFSDPLREPMERLDVKASMGGFNIGDVGNASPAEVAIDVSMGGGEIDLGGRWSRDANVSLDLRMGGGRVRVPSNVRVLGIDRGGAPSVEPKPEVALPTLTFQVKADDPDDLVFDFD
jgi:hypothetical protein